MKAAATVFISPFWKTEMTDIKSLSKEELKNEIKELNLPAFRANQIYKWLHKEGVSSFDEMTDISKSLREELKEKFSISSCEIEDKYVSKLDETVKYLFRLNDGEYIESVIMKYKYGYTICVSSQVGCKMGCKFCASTLAGFKRNLLSGEMESQLHAAQKDLGIRISHIVLMGIGEPLDNFDNVIKFIRNVNNENGLNISMRDITLSTCGLVDKIYLLMNENLPITLTYYNRTSRRVSFEYTLIKDVNDSRENALELAKKLKGFNCHVNLIPVNDVEERGNVRSSEKAVNNFLEILKSKGINATIRRTLGKDINASCGQLRRKKQESEQI